MKLKNLLVILTSLLLSLAVLACAPAGSGGDDGAGVGGACENDGDCGGDLRCLRSALQCVQLCTSNADCGGGTCISINATTAYCSLDGNGNNAANNTGNNAANNTGNNAANNTGNNTDPGNNAVNNTGNNTDPNNNAVNNTGNNTGNNTNNGGGANDCPDVFQCLQGCGEDDQACAEACIGDATPAGQAAFQAVVQCLEANGCYDETDQAAFEACAEQSCTPELDGCFGGGTVDPGDGELLCLQDCAGDADCPGGQQCVDVTTEGNFQCVEGQNVPADAPACSAQGECPDGSTCYQIGGGGGGDEQGVCLMPCSTDTDCPGGQQCVDVTGQGHNECVEGQNVPADAPICDAQTPCPEGFDGCFIVQ